MSVHIVIDNARQEDLERMCLITEQAKAQLKGMGVDQWQSGYPCREIWEKDIALERVYAVRSESGELLGQFVYMQEADPSYAKIEGAWQSDAPYACVHRVCVCDEAKGLGIAGQMFAWAFQKAQEAHLGSVRIDTHQDNLPMQRALSKAGFVPCGIIHLVGGAEDGSLRMAFEHVIGQ